MAHSEKHDNGAITDFIIACKLWIWRFFDSMDNVFHGMCHIARYGHTVSWISINAKGGRIANLYACYGSYSRKLPRLDRADGAAIEREVRARTFWNVYMLDIVRNNLKPLYFLSAG